MEIPKKRLSSGDEMPVVGLGTWQLNGENCFRIVSEALRLGYRHIDTALMYENHKEIGRAIAESGIDREKIFVTSKFYRDLSYDGVLEQLDQTLEELGLHYLDLFLIHWPNRSYPMKETFAALREAYESGKVRNIGVSNFTVRHLKEALEVTQVPIANNQVEFHPFLYQKELLDFCTENGIIVTAYSPLGRGDILDDRVIGELAKKHEKNPAQIILKWLIEKGIIVIPKSSSREHLRSNMEIFDFELEKEDMKRIDSLNKRHRYLNPSFAEFDE